MITQEELFNDEHSNKYLYKPAGYGSALCMVIKDSQFLMD